jgi:hypothetical protein
VSHQGGCRSTEHRAEHRAPCGLSLQRVFDPTALPGPTCQAGLLEISRTDRHSLKFIAIAESKNPSPAAPGRISHRKVFLRLLASRNRLAQLCSGAVAQPLTVDGLETVTAMRRRSVAAAAKQVIYCPQSRPVGLPSNCRIESVTEPHVVVGQPLSRCETFLADFQRGGIGALGRRESRCSPHGGVLSNCIVPLILWDEALANRLQ